MSSDAVAIIDVGSNSVRLVVYDVSDGRGRILLNEKVQAGLGQGLSGKNRLYPQGVRIAMQALARYARLLETLGVSRVFAGATGAVRDSCDGEDFCKRVKKRTGLQLRILSGEEEARYAALGVLMSYPGADGLAGDLGGWSLELSRLKKGRYKSGSSGAVGPLLLESLGGVLDKAVRARARKIVCAIPDLREAETLYLVGGAWRALARLHMREQKWPLLQLQHYEMPTKSLTSFLKHLQEGEPELEALMMQITPRRSVHLPYAALLLEILLSETGARRALMSVSGVREGLLMESMPGIACGEEVLTPHIPSGQAALAQATADWISGIPGLPERALVRAACAWSLAVAGLVPDGRAQIGFEMVTQADLRYLSHRDRIILALAVASSHRRNFTAPACETLLSKGQRTSAQALGALIRLAGELSGTTSILLGSARLCTKAGRLILEASESCLLSGNVERRLSQAAILLGRVGESRIVSAGK